MMCKRDTQRRPPRFLPPCSMPANQPNVNWRTVPVAPSRRGRRRRIHQRQHAGPIHSEHHQANRRSAPCNGVQTTNPILIMTRHVESHMQRMCVGWFRLQYPAVGKLLFAVPNGGARSRTEAAIMKAEGVTAGVTDLILLLGRGGFNALCIEMKTTDRHSALSDAQIEWRSLAITNGSRHVVCRTLEEFQSEIRWYMARPANNEPRDEITCARPIVPPSVEEIERAFGKIRRHKINHQPTKTEKQ